MDDTNSMVHGVFTEKLHIFSLRGDETKKHTETASSQC